MSAARRIAIYVHHHGGGHASRAEAIGSALAAAGVEVTYLTSLDRGRFAGGEVIPLPLDTDLGGDGGEGGGFGGGAGAGFGEGEREPELPPELHFAPLGSAGLQGRMATIAASIAARRPDLVLVDVSVEVALLVRLCGARFAYVRQSGCREDPPHRLAYGWAAGLLAPYPEWLEPAWAPASLRERSAYVGGVTRFDGATRPGPGERPRRALVVGEGAARIGADLAGAARGWEVLVAAPGGIDPAAVDLDLLASCAVVVAPGGANTVAEAAFARCGLVCIPRPRPFAEQEARGEDLERTAAAAVSWGPPQSSEWPALLERAERRASALANWADGGGAARAGAYLEALAAGSSRSEPSSQRTSPAAASSSNQPGAGQLPQRSR